MNSLLWTFLRLRKTCKHAYMSITSDSDRDDSLTVSLKMVLAGHADQAPRKGGRQSSRQEGGPGTQTPHPAPHASPAPPCTPCPRTFPCKKGQEARPCPNPRTCPCKNGQEARP